MQRDAEAAQRKAEAERRELERELAAARRQSQLLLAAQARALKSGEALVSKRIDVTGKGVGTVLSTRHTIGKPTLHVVRFDGDGSDGREEAVLLAKSGGAAGKGLEFIVLDD